MWKDLLKESNTAGKTHNDTFFVDDMPRLRTRVADKTLPKIESIELYHDDHLVYGFEVFYEGGIQVGHHFGKLISAEIKCDRFTLEQGEYITGVEGRTGDLVD